MWRIKPRCLMNWFQNWRSCWWWSPPWPDQDGPALFRLSSATIFGGFSLKGPASTPYLSGYVWICVEMSATTNPCIHLPQICLSELAILLLKMCQISLVDQIVEIVKFSLIKLISFPALVDTVLSASEGLPPIHLIRLSVPTHALEHLESLSRI